MQSKQIVWLKGHWRYLPKPYMIQYSVREN